MAGLVVGAIAVGALSTGALMAFGMTLLPEFREGHFVMQVTAPAGISLGEMTRIGERISRKVAAIDGVSTVSLQVGRAEAGEDTWSPNRAELHVELIADATGAQQIEVEQSLRRALDASLACSRRW